MTERKFKTKGIFLDNTDHIITRGANSQSIIVCKDGQRLAAGRNFKLAECLLLVAQGRWVEIIEED